MHLDDMMPHEKVEYEREISILQKINHPLIVKYIDRFVSADNTIHIVTELCAAGSLS